MRNIIVLLAATILAVGFSSCKEEGEGKDKDPARKSFNEVYRPQYHFSPRAHWMNDPNGMVYYEGEYHLFFQHFPQALQWGPMHWGHATAEDLFHWDRHKIALYPDSLGYIFSGSAVVDNNNTTGFKSGDDAPLVAIFTHHDPDNSKEVQSIAYSRDGGESWSKYQGNPVIKNPGIEDFRDPKVFWHKPTARWIMTLAAGDHVRFYSSPDLKEWKLESTFGKNAGAHGGVWECPDLFPLPLDGDEQNKKWVLLVSTNPGAPNGGSGTQYFVGRFDGHRFDNQTQKHRWIDYGSDNYAGVTWSNAPERRLFMGWMNNWTYAEQIPTSTWRGAMTLPRRLSLQTVHGQPRLISQPAREVGDLGQRVFSLEDKKLSENSLNKEFVDIDLREAKISLDMATGNATDIILRLTNKEGRALELGFEKQEKELYLDRRDAGVDSFHQAFPKIHTAPLTQWPDQLNLEIYLDRSSVELFVNGGERVMTDRIFNKKAFSRLEIFTSSGTARLEKLEVSEIKSVWSKEKMN